MQADSKIQEGCTAGLQHSILAPGRSCGCRDRSVSRGLLQLPEELLGRVVHFLSPEDLTVAAQSSRLLRVVGNSETLWQQLYISRYWMHCSGFSDCILVPFQALQSPVPDVPQFTHAGCQAIWGMEG